MGIMVGLPSPSGSEKDLQLNLWKEYDCTGRNESSSPACRMGSAKRHTVDMACMPVQIGHIC